MDNKEYYVFNSAELLRKTAVRRIISYKKILLILGFLLVLIIAFLVYFLLIPPQVISTNLNENIDINYQIVINFDKPIDRRKVNYTFTPEAYGELQYEKPLFGKHLYRSLIFTPAIKFSPDTEYDLKLTGIVSPIGLGKSNNIDLHFKTKNIEILKVPDLTIGDVISGIISIINNAEPATDTREQVVINNQESKITLLDIPIDWQDSPLSCEAASLKMALKYKNIIVSEKDIMDKIGYDTTVRKDGIWGDPNKAFVGRINGNMCSTGFGVFNEAVTKVAENWRPAKAFTNWGIEDIVREITLGNPVIVWGTLPVKTLTDCSWHTEDGVFIKAYKETHVRLVVGFIEELDSPIKIILNDPLSGRLYWDQDFFLANWKTYNYSGIAIR